MFLALWGRQDHRATRDQLVHRDQRATQAQPVPYQPFLALLVQPVQPVQQVRKVRLVLRVHRERKAAQVHRDQRVILAQIALCPVQWVHRALQGRKE